MSAIVFLWGRQKKMQSVVEYNVAIPWAHEMRLLKRGSMRKSVENQVFLVRRLLINQAQEEVKIERLSDSQESDVME